MAREVIGVCEICGKAVYNDDTDWFEKIGGEKYCVGCVDVGSEVEEGE